jgi:hypothetical protein
LIDINATPVQIGGSCSSSGKRRRLRCMIRGLSLLAPDRRIRAALLPRRWCLSAHADYPVLHTDRWTNIFVV